MLMPEKKAHVISGTNKAAVIAENVRATAVVVEANRPEDTVVCSENPIAFVRRIRQELGIPLDAAFYADTLQKAADILKLPPVAFVLESNHWSLVLKALPHRLHVYDPMKGIATVPYNTGPI